MLQHAVIHLFVGNVQSEQRHVLILVRCAFITDQHRVLQTTSGSLHRLLPAFDYGKVFNSVHANRLDFLLRLFGGVGAGHKSSLSTARSVVPENVFRRLTVVAGLI